MRKGKCMYITNFLKLLLKGYSLVLLCSVFSFSAVAQTVSPTYNSDSFNVNSPTAISDRCSVSGCAKMYPEDNISQLHHKYESAGNPCAFNNCVAGDVGGCSYGSSQLECTYGSLKTFLTNLQKTDPNLWNQLGGGSVEAMNAKACAAPATEFANKWKSLCSTSQGAESFEAAQEKYMQKMYYDTAASSIKKNYGIDFNSLSPELQMSLFSAAVAMGSPGGVNKLMKSIKNNIGDPAQMSETELLAAMYERRDYFYGSSSPAIRESVQKRNAREGTEALESLKIRNAWEAEQKKPADQRKSYEDIVREVTGREPCTGNKSGTFSCSASGAGGGGSSSSSSGSSSTSNTSTAPGLTSHVSSNRADNTCAPSQYKMSYGDCMLCPLFEIIFNTASRIAKLAFDKLATPVLTVVLVAWALWIAFEILKFLSSFKTVDAPSLIKTLLNKSFVILIVVTFLQADSGTFFAMLMEPVFNTGFKLAQMAATDTACTTQYNIMQDGGLPPSMGQSILCTLVAIQQRLLDTMSIGAATMCIGLYVKGSAFILPAIPYVFSGLFIFLGAFIVIIIFPFLLLDTIFQLCVACALLPAAIGAYPFKKTNKYVRKVWDIFMNAMFCFVFMSLVILILTTAIETTLVNSGINKVTDSNFQETAVTVLVWGGVALIKIVFILLLAKAILGETKSYAGQFASSMVSSDIGSKMGGMAAGGTKQMGKKAWSGAKKVGGALKETAQEKIGDMRRNAQMKHIQKHGQKVDVTDKDGNVIGQSFVLEGTSSFRGRKTKQTYTIMNNGSKMLTQEKDYGNGKIEVTKSDGYLKQVETKEMDKKTGEYKVTGSKIKIQTAGLKAARNSDGSLNTTALQLACKNSAFSEKMIKAVTLKQYAEQSGMKFNGDFSEDNISISKDENGREVVQIIQKDDKGNNVANLKMTLPQDGESNRAMVELTNWDKDGNESSYATDGMINRHRVKRFNKKTQKMENIDTYAMSDYYAKRSTYGVDATGEWSNIFEKHGGSAFSPEDLERARKQFLRDRRDSHPERIAKLR